jgi:hypothetical protein
MSGYCQVMETYIPGRGEGGASICQFQPTQSANVNIMSNAYAGQKNVKLAVRTVYILITYTII